MATGTCSFTNQKPLMSASTTTFRVVQVSAYMRGGTHCLRTRSMTYWKFSAVLRLGLPGRPMLVLLYVPLTHFYFSFLHNMPIISDREFFSFFIFFLYATIKTHTYAVIILNSDGLIIIFNNFYSPRLRKR